jgi:hypothetical protein
MELNNMDVPVEPLCTKVLCKWFPIGGAVHKPFSLGKLYKWPMNFLNTVSSIYAYPMTPYSLVTTATTHVQNIMNSKDAMVLNPVLYPVITPASVKGLQKAVTDFLHRMLEAYSCSTM